MAAKIYIDGEHGTTGLKIRERLGMRRDIDLMSIPASERRNPLFRARMLNEADIAILCLPDDASREAVAMLEAGGNNKTRLIDTSTAHRVAPGWAFGFAELTAGQRDEIARSARVTNPGCWSTGAIALLRPLVDAGMLPTEYPVTINGISGYTGGGKSLIAQFEDKADPDPIASVNYLYALGLTHKHVPEIHHRVGLARRPIFTPNVGRFPQGMLVNVPLHLDLLIGQPSLADVHGVLASHYAGQELVKVVPLEESAKAIRLDPQELIGRDDMKLYCLGTPGTGQANLVASLDNLGKGASGAAVQNMDIMLGATNGK